MEVLDAVPLVRNWDISESFAVASFSVIIYQDGQTPHPWDVAEELLRGLQQDLGGRWVLMHRHL